MLRLSVIPNGDYLLEGVSCHLECVFCTEGIAKVLERRRQLGLGRAHRARLARLPGWPSPSAYVARRGAERLEAERIVAEFHAALSADPRPEVVLAAHDILEFERLFDLLGICRALGKRAHIISPGLRLADPAFARRLAPLLSRITITYLSHDPAVYARMTGHDGAQAIVRQAIANLVALDVELCVNFVVTRWNQRDLLGVAATLLDEVGLELFTLVVFCPETGHFELGGDIVALLPRLPELGDELERFAERYQGTRKKLALVNVPPCKVPEAALASDNLRWSPPPPESGLVRRAGHALCARCGFEPRCPKVFASYLERYPEEPFSPERVNPYVQRLRP